MQAWIAAFCRVRITFERRVKNQNRCLVAWGVWTLKPFRLKLRSQAECEVRPGAEGWGQAVGPARSVGGAAALPAVPAPARIVAHTSGGRVRPGGAMHWVRRTPLSHRRERVRHAQRVGAGGSCRRENPRTWQALAQALAWLFAKAQQLLTEWVDALRAPPPRTAVRASRVSASKSSQSSRASTSETKAGSSCSLVGHGRVQ